MSSNRTFSNLNPSLYRSIRQRGCLEDRFVEHCGAGRLSPSAGRRTQLRHPKFKSELAGKIEAGEIVLPASLSFIDTLHRLGYIGGVSQAPC